MINLQTAIRQRILDDVTISSLLPNYLNSKPVFTRVPVPEDAEYPLIVVSPLIAETDRDFISCGARRVATYDIAVYSRNDDATNYRKVEQIAYRLAEIFNRVPRYSLAMPSGSSLIQTTIIGPFPGPTDDLVKVARVVSLNIEYHLENY